MQWWKKTFQAVWMSEDMKPKAEYKRRVSRQTRAQLKSALKKEIKDVVRSQQDD